MIIGKTLLSLTFVDLFPTVARSDLFYLAFESGENVGDGQSFFQQFGLVMMCLIGFEKTKQVRNDVMMGVTREREQLRERTIRTQYLYLIEHPSRRTRPEPMGSLVMMRIRQSNGRLSASTQIVVFHRACSRSVSHPSPLVDRQLRTCSLQSMHARRSHKTIGERCTETA